jgi:hypothetical protein
MVLIVVCGLMACLGIMPLFYEGAPTQWTVAPLGLVHIKGAVNPGKFSNLPDCGMARRIDMNPYPV